MIGFLDLKVLLFGPTFTVPRRVDLVVANVGRYSKDEKGYNHRTMRG